MKKNEIITAKLVGLTTFVHQNFRISYKDKEYVCRLKEPSQFYKIKDYVVNPITLKILETSNDTTNTPLVVELC